MFAGLELGEVAVRCRMAAIVGPTPSARTSSKSHELQQVAHPAEGLAVTPAAGLVAQWLPEREPEGLPVLLDLRDRRVAHAALGHVTIASSSPRRRGSRARAGTRARPSPRCRRKNFTPPTTRYARLGPYERLFHHAALCVGAVEDGDVAEALTLAVGQAGDLTGDERCLVVLVLRLVAGEQLTADLLGPEVLGLRAALLAMTALAASRMRWVDR